ncbi:diguanylate cyclase (GGDEF)-like protein [Oxalobacteraceae bacterium GrIS 2.11]
MLSIYHAVFSRTHLLCSLWAALCLFNIASAQTRPGLVTFQPIAIPDEIPAHLSSAMAQDGQGLIWIGTQDGLVRYDGYSFKVYQPKLDDPTSLSGSYVRAISNARDGHLWVGTISDGLSIFDPHTEQFARYRHDATRSDSLINDRVETIAQDPDGHVWLGTDSGLDRMDPTTGKFEHFQHDPLKPDSLASNQVRAVLVDHRGQLWVGTRNGLQRWVSGTASFTSVGDDEHDPESLRGLHVTRLLEDSRHQIWIGTDNEGAAVFDPQTGHLHLLRPSAKSDAGGLSHYWVYSIAEARPGEVWIGTYGGGINVIDAANLKVIDRFRHDSTSPDSIGGDRIGALLVDRSGLVWVGTWGGGIAWHNPASRAFLKWRHSPNNPDGPTHAEIVRSMEMADGAIWLGTNGNGIDVMDQGGHLRGGFRPSPGDPYALADGSISCMIQAADGTIWVATLDGTLHRMRAGPGRNLFQRFGSGQGLPGGAIRSMAFAPDGALWVGSLNGLARLDPRTDKITSYRHHQSDSTSLSGQEVLALVFAADGTLWVGTDSGVNAFNTNTGKSVRVMHDPKRADSLPDDWVPDLLLAKDGHLWVATQSGAAILDKWDGKVAHFDVLATRLHLPIRPATSLIQDASGTVWIGSRTCIDPRTWQVRNFGPADGDEFRTLYFASRTITKRGELLFGSPEGLLVLRPDRLTNWTYSPPVIVSEASIEGIQLAGANTLKQLVLNAGQHTVRLEFAALDFSAPQSLRYRYRLDGYDPDWVTINAEERVAIYTGLPPGDYQLHIQGSNRSGAWSEAEVNLALSVEPAYYQTWWFKTAMAFAMLLLLALTYQFRIRQISLRSKQLEQAVAERTLDLETAYKQIEEASLTDSLTGLNNRRFLEQTIQSELDLATRQHSGETGQQNSDLVLLMLDLDHFKQVNDQYGHAAGDAVLVQTAHLLKLCMRASDYIVRWGGEEFLLVARFIDRSQAAALAEKIRSTIAAHPYELPNGQVIHKTVSIGFVAYPFIIWHHTPMSLDSLQRIADTALYAAKRSWRNAWVGIDAPPSNDKTGEQIVEQFLNDADSAVREGLVSVIATPDHLEKLKWK